MRNNRRYVIDASVLIKSLVPEAETPFARQFVNDLAAEEGSAIYVPDLLYIECANTL